LDNTVNSKTPNTAQNATCKATLRALMEANGPDMSITWTESYHFTGSLAFRRLSTTVGKMLTGIGSFSD